MIFRRCCSLILACLLDGGALSSLAMSVQPPTFDQFEQAELVFRGEVVAIQCEWTRGDSSRRIVTVVTRNDGAPFTSLEDIELPMVTSSVAGAVSAINGTALTAEVFERMIQVRAQTVRKVQL